MATLIFSFRAAYLIAADKIAHLSVRMLVSVWSLIIL